MSEQEWLVSTDPPGLLRFVTRDGSLPGDGPNRRIIASDRKLRLFAVACCRAVQGGAPCGQCGSTGETGDYRYTPAATVRCRNCGGTGRTGGLTDHRSLAAVEVAERYANGLATEDERDQAWQNASDAWEEAARSGRPLGLINLAQACVRRDIADVLNAPRNHVVPPAVQAELLRCIFGNPWRQVAIEWVCLDGEVYAECPNGNRVSSNHLLSDDSKRCLACGAIRNIKGSSGKVRQIARTIYDDRRWGELSILADALEEAGLLAEEPCYECADAGAVRPYCSECPGTGRVPNSLLAHLRGPGPHARGCFVLDTILGKE